VERQALTVATQVFTLLAVLALDGVEMDAQGCAVLAPVAIRKIDLLAGPAGLASVGLTVRERRDM